MKRTTVILAMMLIAATTFSQSERRTTNREKPAQRTTETRRESNNNQTTVQQKSSGEATQTRQQQPSRTPRDAEKNKAVAPAPNRNVGTSNQRPANNNQSTSTRREPVRNEPQRDDNRHRPNPPHKNAPAHNPGHNHIKNHAVYTKPYKDYSSPRVYREQHVVNHHYKQVPMNRIYRSHHHVYRAPANINIIWTPVIHHRFVEIYPMIKVWYYPTGYRIQTISAYDASYYKGEVMNVYGQVNDMFYSHATDEYFLYIGPYYPYHDFTVVLPGWLARSFNPQPMRFFNNQYLTTTGLITEFDGIPEIVVKDQMQINLY